jgi:hypothetical protein
MRRDNLAHMLSQIIVLDQTWSTFYVVQANSTKFGTHKGNKTQHTEWRLYKYTYNFIICNFLYLLRTSCVIKYTDNLENL